ncbi:LOW QUALITY PROTEIN: endothelial cell-specific chemotaxis regulator isoform X1 [Cricetulus griseus]|uniref:LOW QUALITY PROTEIN: endothelial cell-specific chemotaxis regulator isoform X1 n=1 Tax=Cricetulus griseus TaxID=10029 RepID=UPI0015C2E114|nr:LOW QUALITY PROTEIN: endothelial cell-specific chemotaxis regulator isoform X1 [Cricetulus griseus]
MDREYTEEPPATHPADMGTNGAMRLGSAILGLLLLQGYSSQPTTTQTSHEIIQKASQGSLVSRPITPGPSTLDNHFLSLPGLTSQNHTLGLGTGMPDSSSSSRSSSGSRGAVNSTRGEASLNATPSSVTTSLPTREDVPSPTPTSASALTVVAFGVISFIVILGGVGILLLSVVSLMFKHWKNKESEDPQKPGSSGLSESCSTANGEKDSITLISMKNINMNNSKGCPSAEKIQKQLTTSETLSHVEATLDIWSAPSSSSKTKE